MNAERIAFADKQREAAVLCEETRLRLDHSGLAQLPQRIGPGHHDVRIETGLAADVEREVAERDGSSPYHLHDNRLRYGHHDDIAQIEISILRLRLRPSREGAHDIVAEQRHQVIAFGKD